MTSPLLPVEPAAPADMPGHPENPRPDSAEVMLAPGPSPAETLSLEGMSAVRTLMQELLKQRQVAAVPLGTLELLLGKIFKAAMSVDPGLLMKEPKFTVGDYVKMLNACAKLAEALAKVELVRARLQEIQTPHAPGQARVIPAEIIDAVEKQLNLL